MAYYFTLAVECGNSLDDAKSCMLHFDNLQIAKAGINYSFITELIELDKDGSNLFWVLIYSLDLPSNNPLDEESLNLFTFIGNELLAVLSNFFNFRYSILGIESMDAIEYSEFNESLLIDDKFIKNFSGLVISNELLSMVSKPKEFSFFNKNHVSISPYKYA